jgi:hypothetical protein
MANDERIVEVKTVKTDAPSLSGITLLAVALIVAMGVVIYVVKFAGEATPPLETPTQTQIK